MTRFIGIIMLALLAGFTTATTQLEFGTFSANVVRGGVEFSPNLEELNGQEVVMVGYMAPPLKPRVSWFALTREPMATCPYCSEAADWPADVVFARMPSGRNTNSENHLTLLRVTGQLEIGIDSNVEEGLSLIRLIDVTVERVR